MIQQLGFLVFKSKEVQTCSHTSLHTYVIAALFRITQTGQQPKFPSVGDQINCGTCIHGILLSVTIK